MTNVDVSTVQDYNAPTDLSHYWPASEYLKEESPLPTTHNNPPITVTEMSNFFERISTAVVSASEQGQELRTLRSEIEEIKRQIESLSLENTNLRHERDRYREDYETTQSILTDTEAALRGVQRQNANQFDEINRLKLDLDAEIAASAHARDKIKAVEGDIEDLTRKLEAEKMVSEQLAKSLADAQNERDRAETATFQALQEAKNSEANVEYWKKECVAARDKLTKAQDRLYRIHKVFEQEHVEEPEHDNVVGF